MCEFLEYDGPDYRNLPPNAGADDCIQLWKAQPRRKLPARSQGQTRAQLKTPKPQQEKVDLKWSGGRAGNCNRLWRRVCDPSASPLSYVVEAPFDARHMALGLYVHIPFCSAICNYCNFNRGLFDAGLKKQYVAALGEEIRSRSDGAPADSIFFGGGTPSLLEPSEIAELIETCRAGFALSRDAEITLGKPTPRRSPRSAWPPSARPASTD